ncbi:MAG: hypothetical protein ACETWB_02425 [Anaerolineae bacterium]
MGEPAETKGLDVDLLDDGDIEAAEQAVDAAEKGAEATPAAKPESEADEGEGKFDRSASFRDVMQGFEQFVPEDKRKAYRDRVEQSERWAATANEAKEVKAKLAEIAKVAKELAPMYEGGEDYLERHGPVGFLKQWKLEHGPGAQRPEPPKPAEPAGEQDDLAALIAEQVKRVNAPLAEELERLREERRRDDEAKRFAADFDPKVTAEVDKWGLDDNVKAEVGTAFADVAQNLYMSAVYMNPDNPDAVTISSAIAKASKIFDAIVKARTAKKPTPPRPTVREAQKVEGSDDESGDLYGAAIEGLDVGDDLERHWKESGGV